MRQLFFALRFVGHVASRGDAFNVLSVTASSPGCVITTVAGPNGMSGECASVAGEVIACESEMTFIGETTFHVAGVIHFRSDHSVRFRTVGPGYLIPRIDSQRLQGGSLWQVEGGTGQFTGASGLITSKFSISDTGEISDHQCGVLMIE